MQRKFVTPWMLALAVGLFGIAIFKAYAEPRPDDTSIPHLDAKGRLAYNEFLSAPPHRAFAMATGGAWAWVSDRSSPEEAEAAAIASCAQYTDQTCLPYAVDGDTVFDAHAWAGSWGPYLSAAEAAAATEGMIPKYRFPDLAITSPDGRPMKLSDLRGKIVFLHFWGSWCLPCQIEFPELQKLHDAFEESPKVVFVLLQTRESIADSRLWAQRRGISMPLYDSGAKDGGDNVIRLADGGNISDRRLAPVYPSTYVLDANGIVVFANAGPASGWPDYEPLLRHTMEATTSE